MRLFEWTPEGIRLMRDAAERSDFHARLASEIDAMLGGLSGLRVLDAGCGLGYLSLEMASRGARVTAMDIARPALDVLAARAGAGVEIRCQNALDLPRGEWYDAAVFCLFGDPREALRAARGHCARALVAQKIRPSRGEEASRDGLPTPALSREVALSLDQPFRSLEDAALFFRLYRAPLDGAALRARLLPGPDAAFPYLLPVPRPMRLSCYDL